MQSSSNTKAAIALSTIVLLGSTAGARDSLAEQPSAEAFYRGKAVTLVIGSAVGAGYDAYARLIARHIGKHIPGNPTVVAQNVDGAGGFRAAARVAIAAPQDGTSIGAVYPSTLLDPILGDPRKQLERLRLAYLGSAGKNPAACFIRADAPAASFSDMLEKEIIVGAGTQGSTTRQYAALLKNILGAKLKIAAGYAGNAEIFLAVDRGEVQGMCGTGYVGVISTRPNWLKTGFVKPVVQESSSGVPELNQMGVPLSLAFAKEPLNNPSIMAH